MAKARRPRPSRLNKTQQRFLLLVVVLGVFMLADTLYLLSNRLGNAIKSSWLYKAERGPTKLMCPLKMHPS